MAYRRHPGMEAEIFIKKEQVFAVEKTEEFTPPQALCRRFRDLTHLLA